MNFDEPENINLYSTKTKVYSPKMESTSGSKGLEKFLNVIPMVVVKDLPQPKGTLSQNSAARSEHSQSRLMDNLEHSKGLNSDQRAYIQDRLNQSKHSLLSRRTDDNNSMYQRELNQILNSKKEIQPSHKKSNQSSLTKLVEYNPDLDNSELMSYAGFGATPFNWNP